MSLENIGDFFEDHGVGITIAVCVILFIGFTGYCCNGILEEKDTAETIILHNGSQSYACVASQGDQTPHNCNPIKEAD